MKELGIDRLSVDDRLALVQEIWDSIAEQPDLAPLSDEQKRVLDQRLADLDANPGNVMTWDEIKRSVQANQ
jgi:putative addiction module component (TIGR02574 family)